MSCDGGTYLTSYEMKAWLKRWGVKMRLRSAHYPQSNNWVEYVVKAAKKLVYGNTTSSGALDTDKFLQATLAYCNITIYPETGKMISQSFAGSLSGDTRVLPAQERVHEENSN